MVEKDLISGFSIFSGVSQDHLSEIAQCTEVQEFDSGETIFKDGEEASSIYGVLNGEVELSLVVRDKILKTDIRFEEYSRTQIETIERDIVVDSIGSGEIFGWSALTSSGRFTSTAICAEPTKVFSLSADTLKSIFNQHPQVGYPFMERLVETISNRLTNRTDRLIEGWSQAFNVDRI
jgi:CRP/FNR family transcriptional regulator, cyclic AMP receptor protein